MELPALPEGRRLVGPSSRSRAPSEGEMGKEDGGEEEEEEEAEGVGRDWRKAL